MRDYHVLNLGAGVQSTTLFLLMREGLVKVPANTIAIFADTQEEPAAVYRHLEWLQTLEWPKILIKTAGKLGDDLIFGKGSGRRLTSIPAFTQTAAESSTGGTAKRQCTSDYKVEVIEQAIRRDLLSLKPKQRRPRDIRVIEYFGISRDEARRAVKIKERLAARSGVAMFPLLEMGWTRQDCLRWLEKRVPHLVPRSACVFCPYHDDNEWLRIKDTDAAGWARAVTIDRALRNGAVAMKRFREKLYLHRSGKPLEEVDFDAQGRFPGFVRECEGMCGV